MKGRWRPLVWLSLAWAVAACEVALDLGHLRRPADAAGVADVPSPLDDPFERAMARELPADEPLEARCDGLDDDGDGRVDEGWHYVVHGCPWATAPSERGSTCSPPGRTELARPYWRPHLMLAAGFDGTEGAAIWREGFVQPDNGLVFVRVVWPRGGALRATRMGFAQWRPLAGRSPTQPAVAGSVGFVGGVPIALWGLNPSTCERGACVAQLTSLDRSRVDEASDSGITRVSFPHARGSGLVQAGDDARLAVVGATGGIELYRVRAEMTLDRVGVIMEEIPEGRIGVVRGAAWDGGGFVWVFELRVGDWATALAALWTDADGHTTRGPDVVVMDGALDPGTSLQVASSHGVLMVVHLVGGRGVFLTRYDPTRQSRESVLLSRERGGMRVAWDGATWFACTAGGGTNLRAGLSRFSSLGERLAPEVFVEDGPEDGDNDNTDCAIAAVAGRALVGLGAYSNDTPARQRVVGFACERGASP